MSRAFEIVPEDVQSALARFMSVSDEDAEKLHGHLDFEKVEKAALYGDAMSEQTDYAYEEIREQLLGLKPGGKMTDKTAVRKIKDLLEELA